MPSNNRKTKALKYISSIVFVILMNCVLMGCTGTDTGSYETYKSPEDALIHHFDVDRDKTIGIDELDQFVLYSALSEDTHCYYLMKDSYRSDGKEIPFIYLLDTYDNGGGYVYEKLTAGYSLDSSDMDDDSGDDHYMEYVIPVDDMFVHVGRIFDDGYQAYYEGELLETDEWNIYFLVTEDPEAEVMVAEE